MTAWIVVCACGVFCFLMRFAPVELVARAGTPAWMDRVGMLIAPVAFTALAVAALATAASGGAAALLPRGAAVAVAAVVAHRTHSTGGSILSGMVTLWLATAVFENR